MHPTALAAPVRAKKLSVYVPRSHSGRTNVVCQPLFVCDIVLDAGESILSMATGDSVRWILSTATSGPDGNTPHVLVKPTQYRLRTDLIVATTRRVCYAILVSTAHDEQNFARFYYPITTVALIERNARTKTDASAGPEVNPESLDLAYRMHGDRTIMPVRAMNDGAHTYIEMPTGLQNMPVVFAIGNDGSDTMVNYRFHGRSFIIDGVPSGITLVEGSGRHQRRAIIERGS